MRASHIEVPVHVLATLIPIHILAVAPERTAEDGTNIWASVIHKGDPDGVPGSWFQTFGV